jgi:hypothetical protein
VAEKNKSKRGRPVDYAMHAARSEKKAVRSLWLQTLGAYSEKYPNQKELLYVTLPGAEGIEIGLLAEHEFIRLTETGGISQESMFRIAAIESSKPAVGALQKKFPGLKIYETDFKGLIRGDGLTSYPTGEHKNCCRARIINLDMNEILTYDGASFPILAWIQKLGEMHAAAPRIDWCLYLTLHGEVRWTSEACHAVRQFLSENFARALQFASSARSLLGNDLFDKIAGDGELHFPDLNRELQQKILMTFVPKKIADLVRSQMWRLETRANLRYGQSGHAPMVTWIIDFTFDSRAAGRPDAVYLDSVNGILAAAGQIDSQGRVVPD